MSMLTDVKTALRIGHDELDDEIQADIDSAKQRLRMMGCRAVDEEDALTSVAIKLHAKASFNFQGDGQRYAEAFESLGKMMALAREYNGRGDCYE